MISLLTALGLSAALPARRDMRQWSKRPPKPAPSAIDRNLDPMKPGTLAQYDRDMTAVLEVGAMWRPSRHVKPAQKRRISERRWLRRWEARAGQARGHQ